MKRKRRSRRSGGRELDLKALSEELADDIARIFGLDVLDLDKSEVLELGENLIRSVITPGTSPSRDSILKRLRNLREKLYQTVASYILARRERLTVDQLEFIVHSGGEAALSDVPRLYREALRHGRRDLIPPLRIRWAESQYRLPISCPNCGFMSVTPDFECVVCGEPIRESDVKEELDLIGMLVDKALEEGREWVIKAIERGEVYYSERYGLTLRPPSNCLFYTLKITGREKGEVFKRLEKATSK